MTTQTPMTTRRPLARTLTGLSGLTLAALLTLTACSGEADSAEFTDSAQGASQDTSGTDAAAQSPSGGSTVEPSATGDGAGGESGAGERSASVVPADAAETITYDIPSEGIDGTVTVGLHHLERRGQTLELLLTYTPEFSGNETQTLFDLHAGDHSLVAPALFDRENLKRYDILRVGGAWDTGAHWATSQGKVELASGETQPYWATFAAPEDEIDTLNVAVPAGPEFQDVTIETASGTDSEGGTGAEDGDS